MGIRENDWRFHVGQLKGMTTKEGIGDITRIRNYLNKLSDKELADIEALVYMGEYGIDFLEVAIDSWIQQTGTYPKNDLIDNICSKSRNIEERMQRVEKILNNDF